MDYFFEEERTPIRKKKARELTLADLFHQQTEAFYAIPEEYPPKDELRFSPSMISKCCREQFFIGINAPKDLVWDVTPWKARVPRNGEAIHEFTQRDYLKMEQKLKDNGYEVQFKFLEPEVVGRKEFDVNGVKVILSGRCDGILQYVPDETKIVWEKKTKTRLESLDKLKKPQPDHIQQVTAYSLIFGINKTIFEYESCEKPKWSENDKEDIKHFFVEVSEKQEQELLEKLAEIVQAVETSTPPPKEKSKCFFCNYKTECSKYE